MLLSLALALAVSAFTAAGCGGGSSKSPDQVVNDFLQASMDENVDAAYAMLTQESKDELGSKEDLSGLSGDIGSYDVGSAKISGDEAKVPVTMEIKDSGYEMEFDMVLVKEDGAWKISLSATEVEMEKALDELMQEIELPQ